MPFPLGKWETLQHMLSTNILYATLPRRIKASIIDGVFVLALFILSPMAIAAITGRETGLNALAMFAPLLVLEPLLVSLCGFTLGQYLFGIQVVRQDTGGKCPLFASFMRYYTKALLGTLSIAVMLFSKKHQAIHDQVAQTLVVLSRKRIEKDPEFAQYGEREQMHEDDSTFAYPSALRRFSFFCLWMIVASILYGFIAETAAQILLPGYTIESESLPKPIEIAVNAIYSILFISIAVLASKGYLPGAKRKQK